MQVASRNGNVSRKSGLSHSLSMYSAPPTEELTIDEFEVMSLDRLQLLRGLELLKTRGYEGKEMMEKIKQVRRTKSTEDLSSLLRPDIIAIFDISTNSMIIYLRMLSIHSILFSRFSLYPDE